MRYMCLVHFEIDKLTSQPLPARQDVDRRSIAYNEQLKASGNFVAAEAIETSESAVLVRVRDGKAQMTDGPYMETKEQMAGFVLVEARDMNEALRLAAGIPLAEIGTIEVRPVFNVPEPPPV